MKYINTLNGTVIDVTVPISGKYWREYTGEKEVEEEVVTATKTESAQQKEENEDFDLTKMTIAELKDYAKENEIELSSDTTKKDDIIQVIADAFQG